MKRKIIAVLLILVMLLSFGGCGEKHTDKLVLAVRSGTYATVIKQCIPAFEQAKGISCEVVELSEDDLHNNVLNDSVRRNGAYDVVMVDSSWIMEYVSEEVLADLGALGYSLDSDIIPATTTVCIQNGKTYLAPFYGNVTVMMYNSKILSDLGYNSSDVDTLDELLASCEKAQKAGYGGFVYRGDTENNVVVDFLPILCAFGGWVIDNNNKPTVNTTAFANAMEYYLKLVKTGGKLKKDELIPAIESGKMVTAVGWPGWYNTDNKQTDYGAFPGKVSENSQSYNSNIYGIWMIGVTENSTNKEMAVELLKHLMDKDVQKSTVESGGVPCRYSTLKDTEVLKIEPHFKDICTALENGVYRPIMQEWPRFYTILGGEMMKILNGNVSVSDGLRVAQEELEALMKTR